MLQLVRVRLDRQNSSSTVRMGVSVPSFKHTPTCKIHRLKRGRDDAAAPSVSVSIELKRNKSRERRIQAVDELRDA